MERKFFVQGIPWAACFKSSDGRVDANDIIAFIDPAGFHLSPLFTEEDLAARFVVGEVGQRLANEEGRQVVAFQVESAELFGKILDYLDGRGITHVVFDPGETTGGGLAEIKELRKSLPS